MEVNVIDPPTPIYFPFLLYLPTSCWEQWKHYKHTWKYGDGRSSQFAAPCCLSFIGNLTEQFSSHTLSPKSKVFVAPSMNPLPMECIQANSLYLPFLYILDLGRMRPRKSVHDNNEQWSFQLPSPQHTSDSSLTSLLEIWLNWVIQRSLVAQTHPTQPKFKAFACGSMTPSIILDLLLTYICRRSSHSHSPSFYSSTSTYEQVDDITTTEQERPPPSHPSQHDRIVHSYV